MRTINVSVILLLFLFLCGCGSHPGDQTLLDNFVKPAEILKIPRTQLLYRMKKLGIGED